jgi:hypothetical protein
MLVRDTRAPTVSRALAAPPSQPFFPWLPCRFVGADTPALGVCSPSCCSSRCSLRAWGARWACTKTMTRKPHSVIPRRSLLLCAARACARSRLRTCSPVCACCRNRCQDGGTFCVQMDNEGFYGNPVDEAVALAGGKNPFCPKALDCNGLPTHLRGTGTCI